MTMLIMGIVLVRNIFSGATDSVNSINDGVKAEITKLWAEEGTKIGIKLGSNKLAKVKQGSSDFGVAIGATTYNAGGDGSKLSYHLELFNDVDDCAHKNSDFGKYIQTHSFSGSPAKTAQMSFEKVDGSNAFVILFFDIPDNAVPCTQRIKFVVKDATTASLPEYYDTFRLQIVQKGIF